MMKSSNPNLPPGMEVAPEVEIKQSEIDSSRLGIWCKKMIPSGQKFGPFVGDRVLEGTDDMDPSFVWEIVDLETKEFLFYINATDPKCGNWMRYISCARYFEEQNIVSQQEGTDIFYKAIKDIEPGEELLTWYDKAPFRVRKKARKPTTRKRSEKAPSTDDSVVSEKQELSEVEATPVTPEAPAEDLDMHISKRGRRRKVTKYWELEHQDNSDNSDFQRDSDVINSEDDMTIASDDDWNAGTMTKQTETQQITSHSEPTDHLYQFEVKPYQIVKSRLGRKVFKCDICSGVYRHSFSLKRHYIRNHINHKYVSQTDLLNCNVSLRQKDEAEVDGTQAEKTKLDEGSIASCDGSETKSSEGSQELTPVDDNANKVGFEEEDGNLGNADKENVAGVPQNPTVNAVSSADADQAKEADTKKPENEDIPELYRCNVCDAVFDHVGDLKTHLSNHPESSSKSFACDKCDMKFTHKQNLMRHHAVHSGARPYICNYCNKKFPTITNLNRHERIHQGRRISCDYCCSSFSQTGDLKKHIRKLHPELFFECGFCTKYFSQEDALLDHLKESHKEDKDSNSKEISFRKEAFKVDLESDRAESMRLALQRGPAISKEKYKFACTVCKKRFVDYANMCRHRRLAHQRHLLHLDVMKKESPELSQPNSPLRALFDPDMDKNNTFYAKVARNIADNLKYHIEGKRDELKQKDVLIKWKSSDLLSDTDSSNFSLQEYNFPAGYSFSDKSNLYRVKIPLTDYVHSSGLAKIETSRLVIQATKIKSESNEHVNSKKHELENTQNVANLSPAKLPKGRSKANVPPVVDKSPMSLKVPDMKLCKLCNAVFHNSNAFKEHMVKEHRTTLPHVIKACEKLAPSVKTTDYVINNNPAHTHARCVMPPVPVPKGANPNKCMSQLMERRKGPPAAHQLLPFWRSTMFNIKPENIMSMPSPGVSPTANHCESPTVDTEDISVETRDNSTEAPQKSPEVPSDAPDVTQPLPADPKDEVEKSSETKLDVDPEKPQVTGEDPTLPPRKFLCLACFDEFPGEAALKAHQEERHRTVMCKSTAVDLSYQATWFTKPNPVGSLNVTSSQVPNVGDTSLSQKLSCTKCSRQFATTADLHSHILECGDYGKNAPQLAYIWYLRGKMITPKKKKHGHGKFRKGRSETPHKRKLSDQRFPDLSAHEATLRAQRRLLERQMSLDSPDENEEAGRRSRRRIQELFYNPHNHIRRRDMAQLLGNKCHGCNETFNEVAQLERHLPVCAEKDKIVGTSSNQMKSVVNDDEECDNFDPSKHMCIYCEKQFTYQGMLRKHVVDVCSTRKELVEKGEYIDDEWELDLDVKTGHVSGKSTLSRQSSVSSLNGLLAEDAENSQDSADMRGKKRRRRRGHNWGYKPKGSRQKRVEEDCPYMIEHSFFADAGNVDSVEDEYSNDSSLMQQATETQDDVFNENDDKASGDKEEKKDKETDGSHEDDAVLGVKEKLAMKIKGGTKKAKGKADVGEAGENGELKGDEPGDKSNIATASGPQWLEEEDDEDVALCDLKKELDAPKAEERDESVPRKRKRKGPRLTLKKGRRSQPCTSQIDLQQEAEASVGDEVPTEDLHIDLPSENTPQAGKKRPVPSQSSPPGKKRKKVSEGEVAADTDTAKTAGKNKKNPKTAHQRSKSVPGLTKGKAVGKTSDAKQAVKTSVNRKSTGGV